MCCTDKFNSCQDIPKIINQGFSTSALLHVHLYRIIHIIFHRPLWCTEIMEDKYSSNDSPTTGHFHRLAQMKIVPFYLHRVPWIRRINYNIMCISARTKINQHIKFVGKCVLEFLFGRLNRFLSILDDIFTINTWKIKQLRKFSVSKLEEHTCICKQQKSLKLIFPQT